MPDLPRAYRLDRAADFAVHEISTVRFDALTGYGFFWLLEGASLLRSALVLLSRAEADTLSHVQRKASNRNAPVPAPLFKQAVMLAAMAVECAFKSILAETRGVSRNGKLQVKDWGKKRHDLEKLAALASIQPEDDHRQTPVVVFGLDPASIHGVPVPDALGHLDSFGTPVGSLRVDNRTYQPGGFAAHAADPDCGYRKVPIHSFRQSVSSGPSRTRQWQPCVYGGVPVFQSDRRQSLQ